MIIHFSHIMHLGMTIMAGCDAVCGFGCKDLVGFGLPVSPPLLLKTGLEVSPPAATAEVIGSVGCHINEIFLTHNRFNNISQIFGNRVAKRFSDQLTGILDRELDLSFFVPVRRWLEFAVPDPFCIKLNDTFDFKVVRDIEFLQSCPDCE